MSTNPVETKPGRTGQGGVRLEVGLAYILSGLLLFVAVPWLSWTGFGLTVSTNPGLTAGVFAWSAVAMAEAVCIAFGSIASIMGLSLRNIGSLRWANRLYFVAINLGILRAFVGILWAFAVLIHGGPIGGLAFLLILALYVALPAGATFLEFLNMPCLWHVREKWEWVQTMDHLQIERALVGQVSNLPVNPGSSAES